MIEWLIQSTADLPALPAEAWLSPPEQERLRELRVEKKRQEWLLGRWTAKRLAQAVLLREGHGHVELADLSITPAPDGAPELRILASGGGAGEPGSPTMLINSGGRAGKPGSPTLSSSSGGRAGKPGSPTLSSSSGGRVGEPGSPTISISHSAGRAFCALASGGAAVGADIESIAPRAPRFSADYFTEGEQGLVAAAPVGLRDALTTAIWSAKEAALKALRLGLTVDTRRVECLVPPAGEGWTPFTATCDASLGGPPAGLRCWWRRLDDVVLTLAAA